MPMEKMVIFHNLLDENARPAMERWVSPLSCSGCADSVSLDKQISHVSPGACSGRGRKTLACILIGSMKTGPMTFPCAEDTKD